MIFKQKAFCLEALLYDDEKGLKSLTNLENFRLLKKIIETGESH